MIGSLAPVALDDLKALLGRPSAYPDAPKQVELRETHISCVFLTDRFVYKLKKPVRFEFLDFSTPERRRQACEDEVRLNRRMAPEVYLGVVPVTHEADGRLELDGAGEPVEWLVKMRRLPDDRMLDRLIRQGRLKPHDVDQLAHWLAGYYAAVAPLWLPADDYRRAVEAHVRANRDDLLKAVEPADQARVKRIHTAQLTLLIRRPELLTERVVNGRIVDGHGDLRPEHVCFDARPLAYDCVEFSADLRRIDVVDELCFLAMECRALGADDVGRRVVEAYRRAAGDTPPDELLRFYESYRACVRAKVAALRAAQQTGAPRDASLAEVRRYLDLADDAARPLGKPRLIVVRGLMGTGKSTLARELCADLGAEWLRTDAIRREQFGPADGRPEFGTGKYSADKRTAVYDALLGEAARMLGEGLTVVADGTFLRADTLRKAAATATTAGAELLVVDCHCPPETAKQRIADRLRAGGDVSEARPELYDRQLADAEPIPATLTALVVDTCLPLATQTAAIYEQLR